MQAPREFGEEAILAVHTASYLEFLKTAYDRWKQAFGENRAGPYACAHASPTRYPARVPASIQAQVGYFLSGGSAPIDAGTWAAARAAAMRALDVADRVAGGLCEGYAICRPPGHHAYADLAGGFCYLNNAAIAGRLLADRQGRTAILDIDVHHGNGTQDIFYRDGNVLFASIHADTNEVFPFYVGYADETGEGEGKGANLNLPLPRRSKDKVFLDALDTALALPSRSPALNPVENLWQYLRSNRISNRISNSVFDDDDAIIDAACNAWTRLMAQPQTITSIGMRKRAHVGQSK